MAAPGRISEQVPINALPDLVGHMQPDCFGEVIAHPATGLDMGLGGRFHTLAGQPEPIPQPLRIGGAFTVGRPIGLAPVAGVALQRPPQAKHRLPLPLQPSSRPLIRGIELQPNHRHRPRIREVRRLRWTAPPRHVHHGGAPERVVGRGWHSLMQAPTTDKSAVAETCCRSPGCAPARTTPSAATDPILSDIAVRSASARRQRLP